MENLKLIIDTSTSKLAVGIAKGNKVIYNVQYEASRKHSELAAFEVQKALKKCKIKAKDLDTIVVCNGPGSFTGIRVGLTLGKVMAKALEKKLITLDKLTILAPPKGDSLVILDARANNVYYAFFENGVLKGDLRKDKLNRVEKKINSHKIVGDTYLLNIKSEPVDIVEKMNLISNLKAPLSNVDSVGAIYLDEKVVD